MAKIKIYGVITDIYPAYEKDGEIKSQEFKMEETFGSGKSQPINIKVLSENMTEDYAMLCNVGDDVTVTANLSSREYNDRIYYDLLLSKIESGNTTGEQQRKKNSTPCVAGSSTESF